MVELLAAPTSAQLDALTALWEASVRATHHFLAPGEIARYRRLVRREALPAATLFVIRRADGTFAAFAGAAADKIEMLFVAPDCMGRGLGRMLVSHLSARGLRRVDVNEENAAAAAFYARMGFRIAARDATDPSGRAHPILHLELPG